MKLRVRVQPNAKQDCVKETLADGTMKINLTAPPIEGRANEALIEFLSQHFKVPKSKIKIIKGLKSRNKVVEIHHE